MPHAGATRSLVSDIDIVVLAGGLGTRLGSLLPGVPKILAPIGSRPFLDYLLEWLIEQGAARVVLSLGYRAELVKAYLNAHPFPRLEVLPVVEPHPLGTAGAVRFALPELRTDPVMVMNGDTMVEADLAAFLASHRQARLGASVLCARVDDAHRYGRIEIDSRDRIARFEEKSSTGAAPSWVNAGIYLLDRTTLEEIAKRQHGSLERDILEAMPPGSIHACRTEARFLDIGTPESLTLAASFLERWELHPEIENS